MLVLDNLTTGHRQAIGQTPFVQADINNGAALNTVFREHPIGAVVHFAARCLVGESMVRPEVYYRQNVAGTLTLLETMLAHGVHRLVFSSTAAVYGEPVQIPITESHPTKAINPYGSSKLAVEEMLSWLDRAYGLKFVALRYFNAAGADPSGEMGEDHHPETHLIPRLLMTARGGLPEITVFGTDYNTPDGTCIRDYIHTCDLAEAHLLALKRLLDGGPSVVLNLGSGRGCSIQEAIQTAQEVTGRKITVTKGVRRPGDPAVLVASYEKAWHEMGWRPIFSDLKTIITTAWKWHCQNPEGYRK